MRDRISTNAAAAGHTVSSTTRHPKSRAPQRRGRPSKFGRPSRLVALTLPADVIRGLRDVHPDIAWAVVSLYEKREPAYHNPLHADAELVNIGERESLIVINRAAFNELPGVDITPLDDERAFLALDPGCGIGDLENALLHRLGSPAIAASERRTLVAFRRQLRGWRRNRDFRIYTRAIIVIERLRAEVSADVRKGRANPRTASRGATRLVVPKTAKERIEE